MKIYLDDIKIPPTKKWTLAKNKDEFVNLVKLGLLITEISFDHDLGEKDDGTLEETGMDIAKWFVNFAMDNPQVIIDLDYIIIHSGNPVGANNIARLFINARKHGIINTDVKIKFSDGRSV